MNAPTAGRGRRRLGPTAAVLLAGAATAIAPSLAAASARVRVPLAARTAAGHRLPATIGAPRRTRGATLAAIEVAVEARSRPGAGRRIWRVGTATSWSSEPQVLLVLAAAYSHGREWLRVLLPIRPNHATGWIPRDDAVLFSTRYWVTVDKHARTVAVYRNGTRIRRFHAVIGKPATPTPDGLAAIYEKNPQPDPFGFLGPWVLSLTVFSNVLHNFDGGPGRVAIHGRDGASLNDPLGSARSHGCVRIDNSGIGWMAAHLPQGTPVQITG